ncbi:MAG: hypothetical protein H6681_04755 [Desulfobacteraceae bacterium]|nr:hypothetical protein [Desulfobacteraceae bacterium]MCB9494733.1 hypothetical protein [Desulfobacteraceae bacterium]
MLFVGLKYCGGCSSRFDRVALVSGIKERLNGKIEFVHYENRKALITLVVCGCESACVNMEQLPAEDLFTIFRKEHAEEFIKKIESMDR